MHQHRIQGILCVASRGAEVGLQIQFRLKFHGGVDFPSVKLRVLEALEMDDEYSGRAEDGELFSSTNFPITSRTLVFIVVIQELRGCEVSKRLADGGVLRHFEGEVQEGIVLVGLEVTLTTLHLRSEIAAKNAINETGFLDGLFLHPLPTQHVLLQSVEHEAKKLMRILLPTNTKSL